MTPKLTAEQYYADATCMAMADGLPFTAIGDALKVTMECPDAFKAQAFNSAIWAAIRLREIRADQQRMYIRHRP